MAKNVLLSIDLNNVSSEQRSVFNQALADEKWVKHSRLTTVWTAVFQEDVTESGAVGTTKKDVTTAASKAKITNYDALIHVGDSKPTEYSIKN
jgi:hypothetical protein